MISAGRYESDPMFDAQRRDPSLSRRSEQRRLLQSSRGRCVARRSRSVFCVDGEHAPDRPLAPTHHRALKGLTAPGGQTLDAAGDATHLALQTDHRYAIERRDPGAAESAAREHVRAAVRSHYDTIVDD